MNKNIRNIYLIMLQQGKKIGLLYGEDDIGKYTSHFCNYSRDQLVQEALDTVSVLTKELTCTGPKKYWKTV